uniref:Phage protein n=2 Tax=Steinernema glaseri TaxID=37863 RepID=A0A1I7XXI9_9BILA
MHTYANQYQFYVKQIGGHQCFSSDEWFRSDKTHLRVRGVVNTYNPTGEPPNGTLEEAVQCSRRMVPYLTNLKEIYVSLFLGQPERFDFLWKRPCHTLTHFRSDMMVINWHLENNDRLKCMKTYLYSYDKVRDLLPLCVEKRLTWKMEFIPYSNFSEGVKTWEGDAQWDKIYPLFTEMNIFKKRALLKDGTAFYEDEHMRKELVCVSIFASSLTITWK